jgi:DNA-nicking Smr family endonuclease
MSHSDDPKKPFSPEDKEAWERFTHEIKPLVKKPEIEDFAALLDEGVQKKIVPTKPEKSISAEPVAKNITKESSPQLDRRTEEKLRRGKMPIEARLDLHGMSQARAHQALNDFIVASATSGLRCVLVITGKGVSIRTSDDWLESPKGVLREKVPEWLRSGLLSRHILKYFQAQPKDGGAGALYVYLKRQR